MRQFNIKCQVRSKKYKTYRLYLGKEGKIAPNILKRNFVLRNLTKNSDRYNRV